LDNTKAQRLRYCFKVTGCHDTIFCRAWQHMNSWIAAPEAESPGYKSFLYKSFLSVQVAEKVSHSGLPPLYNKDRSALERNGFVAEPARWFMRPVVKVPLLVLFLVVIALVMTLVAGPVPKKPQTLTVGQTYCSGLTPCVLTYHNDNNRDGVNPNESVLKASTLSSSSHPVPQWFATTDGQIYAQPLYVHQMVLGGQPKNAVYVATENNSVYVFDSDSTSSTGTVLTNTNLNNAGDLGSGYTEIAVPYGDLDKECNNIVPEVGITGTPVIDVTVTPPVLYLVTKHEDVDSQGVKTYRQKLHGLFADTLQEIPGSPLVLDTTFASTYAPGFSPWTNNQRAGLALVNGPNNTAKIWVAWGSHCDVVPYKGFAIEFTYNYTGTAGFSNTYNVFNSQATCTANRCQSGIWMGGAAPASDAQGNVYFSTGNGDDATQGVGEFANSLVRMNDAGLQDYYSPPDFDVLNRGKTLVACTNPHPTSCSSPCKFDSSGQYCQFAMAPDDWDMGAGGVVLLSPTFKLKNPELLAVGKQGMIYVIFAGNMGHMDAQSSNPDKYACTTATSPASGSIVQCFFGLPPKYNLPGGNRGAPAFLAAQTGSTFKNFMYVAGIGGPLKAYMMVNNNGVGTFSARGATSTALHLFPYPGAVPVVTWQRIGGNLTDAIVWALDTHTYGTLSGSATGAVLYAYRAIPSAGGGAGSLGPELWDTSAYNNSTPGNPGAVKFTLPTIVEGKILLPGGAQGYAPGTSNCPTPSTTVQPTACGGLAMYK
jgi:hypothetical protein